MFSPEKQPPSVDKALANIRKKGDSLSRQTRLSVIPSEYAFAGSLGAAIGANQVKDNEYWLTSDSLLTLPTAVLGGIALGGGIYSAVRMNDIRKARKSETYQEVITDHLDESIDVFRTYDSAEGENTLGMRWYGADHADYSPIDSLDVSLSKLIEFSEEKDIRFLALDAEWVRQALESTRPKNDDAEVDLSQYGNIVHGPTFFTSLKKSRVTIEDPSSPDAVLFTRTSDAARLAEHLYQNGFHSLVAKLVEQIDDPRINNSYDTVFESSDNSADEKLRVFLSVVKQQLEQEFDSNASGAVVTYMDDFSPMRSRLSGFHTIRGESVDGISHVKGVARAEISHQELLGDITLEELLEKLNDSLSSDQTPDALRALYLVLLRKEDSLRHESNKDDEAIDETNATTLQKIIDNPAGPVQILKQIFDKDRQELRYYNKFNHWRSVNIMSTIILSMLVTNIAGSVAINELSDEATKRYEWCKDNDVYDDSQVNHLITRDEWYSMADQECADVYPHSNHLLDVAMDVDLSISEARYAVKDATTNTLVNMLGEDTTNSILQTIGNSFYKGNSEFNNAPPSMYTADLGQSFIGDAGGEGFDNKPVYSVASITGGSTEGYWYTDVFNSASIQGSGIAFSKSGPDLLSQIYGHEESFDAGDSQDARSRADYEVGTTYVSMSGTKLPQLEGTHIIGMSLFDVSDPSKVINVSSDQLELQFGTSTLRVSQELLDQTKAADFSTVGLRYWLKNNDDTTAPNYIPYAPNTIGFNGLRSEAEKEAIGSRTRKELGLNSAAGPHEVFDAVQEKEYSFTPFSDNNSSLPNIENDTVVEAYSAIGETLGELPSYNCNLASAAFLLATIDRPPSYELAQATGFRNNGDTVLTQQEAHAWLLGQDSGIIDPTPFGTSDQADALNPSDASSRPSVFAAAGNFLRENGASLASGLGGLAAASVYIRNRRRLAEISDTLHIRSVARKPHTSETIETIEHALYAPKHAPRPNTSRDVNAISSEELAKRLVTNFGDYTKDDLANLTASDAKLTETEQRRIKRLMKTVQVAKRVMNRSEIV